MAGTIDFMAVFVAAAAAAGTLGIVSWGHPEFAEHGWPGRLVYWGAPATAALAAPAVCVGRPIELLVLRLLCLCAVLAVMATDLVSMRIRRLENVLAGVAGLAIAVSYRDVGFTLLSAGAGAGFLLALGAASISSRHGAAALRQLGDWLRPGDIPVTVGAWAIVGMDAWAIPIVVLLVWTLIRTVLYGRGRSVYPFIPSMGAVAVFGLVVNQ